MSDRLFPLSLQDLLEIIEREREEENSIFGIPESLFFRPDDNKNLGKRFFNKSIDTPIGPAAGPSTQLCQNILSSWLTGARFIELKTVQVLDEIEVRKPCIEMSDVGFNCEWSQELRVDQSLSEYVKAWILVHYLNRDLFGGSGQDLNTVFNMSIGYNLDGIKSKKIQRFISLMKNCSIERDRLLMELPSKYKKLGEMDIGECISDSVTISTMHGTPPYEIEEIGRYFLQEMQLNTILKLNPTLLGRDRVRSIMNDELGYDIEVPDSAFDHDPSFEEVIEIIENLKNEAQGRGLHFGVKLTNTLEVVNRTKSLPAKEKFVYMSGRALYPVTLATARKLRARFGQGLKISFSGGADVFNIPQLVEEGYHPVTVASDILKPGGYLRLFQYIDMLKKGKESVETNPEDIPARYSFDILKNAPDKGSRELNLFDCIFPPCMEGCAASQDIPGYLKLTEQAKFDEGLKLVRETNVFPSVTGSICDHKCYDKCVRNYYDEPVRIRSVKKFLSERGEINNSMAEKSAISNIKVAIVGAGPAGLSCAHTLSKNGVLVTVYEKTKKSGGTIESLIPRFRLGSRTLDSDLKNLSVGNVKFNFESDIDNEALKNLSGNNDFVFFSTGAEQPVRLPVEGADSRGVMSALEVLSDIKSGKKVESGNSIAVIGGGNTAIDVARSLRRLKGKNSAVTLLYRRTLREMPAGVEELREALEEGVEILELTSPEEILLEKGCIYGIRCSKNILKGKGTDGRPLPVKLKNSEFVFNCDTVIPALGQRAEIEKFDIELKTKEGTGNLMFHENIIFGGDCGSGDRTVINAVADGRFAALYILGKTEYFSKKKWGVVKSSRKKLLKKRALRKYSEIPLGAGRISREAAEEESARCLNCDDICDTCVTVCPNRANISYRTGTGTFDIPVIEKNSDNLTTKRYKIVQEYQVANITDFCNHCGNCTTFCPRAGKPFEDKPRLAMSVESFDSDENLFLLSIEEGDRKIIRKRGLRREILKESSNKLYFHDGKMNLTLNRETLAPEAADFSGSGSWHFDDKSLFEMIILIRYLPKYLFRE